MKFFAGILLAVGTVSATTTYELIPSLTTLLTYAITQGSTAWDIYEGGVLGLQQNTDNEKHQCFISFGSLKDDVQKLPAYIDVISQPADSDNTAISVITSNPWYQPGTYFKLFKRSQEMGALFFDLYDKCYFDDLLIAVGRTVNSFSGGFNTMTTLAVYAFNLLDLTNESNDITRMMKIQDNTVTSTNQPKDIGKIMGTIFTKIFNVQVPDVQYQVYN